MLNPIIKILKTLNSSENPWQISLGLLFGATLGLIPMLSPDNFFVLFLPLIINLNINMMLVSILIFSGATYLLGSGKVSESKFLKIHHTDHNIS